MDFNNLIVNIQQKTEKEQMYRAIQSYDIYSSDMESFESIGFIRNVVLDMAVDGNSSAVILFENEDGKTQSFRTNKEAVYFENLINKKAFLSGMICIEEKHIPTLFVASCYTVENRLIDACKNISEDEKRKFQKKVQEFTPELQQDLARIAINLSRRDILALDSPEESSASYITLTEMEALYDIQRKIIPPEFRKEYQRCRRMLENPAALSEKKHYIKVISNILNVNWQDQYYREIDVDEAIKSITSNHIGHDKQIEDLKTQILIANSKKKAPKTMNFIGSSCGCKTLANSFAHAIGVKYAEIDLTGRSGKDTDYLAGTSRIYENGHCGLIWDKLMAAGTHGLLIIKNIDTYDPAILEFIRSLAEKKVFNDGFMEIPMDLSNLWVICTSSSVKHLPMSFRRETHEIYFEKLTENQLISVINNVMIPKLCDEYHMEFKTPLTDEVCKYLLYQLSHTENKRLAMNLEALAIKMLSEEKKEFSSIGICELKDYFNVTNDDADKAENFYSDITALENKFFTNYSLYPSSVRERINMLLDEIRHGEDPKMEEYAIRSIRYLVHITKEIPVQYEMGEVEQRLKKKRCGQDDLAGQVDDALMAEYLSGNDKRMTVLGLWGPPGTGKTTAAEVIAEALGRGYLKLNFGGTGDSTFIKGTSKSIANAGPSLLIRELARKNGTYSYVINFDEFDKGSTESYQAIHELLDPESTCFYDEFLECSIPKNDLLIILTFNDIRKIPAAILDRIRIVEVSGYSLSEKKQIAKNAVLNKMAERFRVNNLSITDDALELLLREYAVMPGIRDLERDMEKLLIRMIKNEKNCDNLCISVDTIREVLGSKRSLVLDDKGSKCAVPGQAMALAVSGNIGSCIAIQVVQDPYQKDAVETSGLLRGSCLESLWDAMSYARRTLKQELPKLHISFRAPAIEKDGASAGAAMYMAIMSCMLNKSLVNCAFTGSIDAFGNIGIVSVDAKLSAAEREGIQRVYIPKENYEQLKEDKKLDRYSIEIIPVSHVDELVNVFFGRNV